MGLHHSPRIVTDSLVICLDPAYTPSVVGTTQLNNLADTSFNTHASLYAGSNGYGTIANGVVTISGNTANSTEGNFLRGVANTGTTVNGNFTTCGWIYRTSSTKGVIMEYRGGSFRCSFQIHDSGMYFYQRETFSPFTTNSTSVGNTNGQNSWDFFALTKSGTLWTFYKNGLPVGSNTYVLTETITNSAYSIGAAWSDDDYYSNCMDGMLGAHYHYTKALSDAEILQNYNALKSRYGHQD